MHTNTSKFRIRSKYGLFTIPKGILSDNKWAPGDLIGFWGLDGEVIHIEKVCSREKLSTMNKEESSYNKKVYKKIAKFGGETGTCGIKSLPEFLMEEFKPKDGQMIYFLPAKYTFFIEELDGEGNVLNNSKTIFVDILDKQMNIAIVANSPHPDVAAVKNAINTNFSYSVEDFLINDFDQALDKYNLIILHQIPSNNSLSVQLANKVKNSEIPVLFIIGSQTKLSIFNNLDLGLNIETSQTFGINEAQAIDNEFFSYFLLDENVKDIIGSFPPLYVPFGNYNLSSEGEVLFFQKILGIETSNPLIYCVNDADKRAAFITGDGIWRWKLMNYAISQDHEAFNEIINKVVRFLALQHDKRQFKVVYDHQIEENEVVVLKAELYNDIYENVTGNEIDLNLVDEQGQEFSYQFSSLENGYFLDMGIMAPGKYTFKAKTSLGDKVFEDRGEFSVLPVIIERVNTVANHRLLYRLAMDNQGKVYYSEQLDELLENISNNDQIKPIVFSQKKYTDLIDIPWLLAGILLLLTVEWLMRKWGGSY